MAGLLKGHNYCEICRDKDDLDIRCTSCGGAFHYFCFSQTYKPELLNKKPFLCEPCIVRHGDNSCDYCKR